MGTVADVWNGTFTEEHIFFKAQDGFIHHTWDTGDAPPYYTSAILAGLEGPLPTAALSEPVALYLQDGAHPFPATEVFYIDVNGNLVNYEWSDPGFWTVNPPLPGSPSFLFGLGALAYHGIEVHLFYVEEDQA